MNLETFSMSLFFISNLKSTSFQAVEREMTERDELYANVCEQATYYINNCDFPDLEVCVYVCTVFDSLCEYTMCVCDCVCIQTVQCIMYITSLRLGYYG